MMIDSLTERERQMIDLLLQGWENDAIAEELKMARRTVKAHFNKLFLKFGIKSGIKRVKLAVLFYRERLQDEDREKKLAASNSVFNSVGTDNGIGNQPCKNDIVGALHMAGVDNSKRNVQRLQERVARRALRANPDKR